ncbi:NADAR domain-containing protein [Ottowia sp. SB7-C50]|uniref:NADAR domain-containing protein n=1 Tax=Ottowia sp. SB7-C50 TaxID=3081231 RepID=UPI002955594A|nr:NADAR domain-containing protein [Ottowia sp. SB7-C50]WOP15905.1 NADAR domain-containing protein [Ottowia sp. SB7-C50]
MSGRDQSRTYSRKDSVVFLKTDEPFGGLSNMAGGYPIHVNGVRILTSEALYQACRFPHLPDVQKLIIGQISPMTAKMRSKPYRKDSRPDWDQVRVRIMRWSLRMKLANNWNAFSTLLLKTGERPIVEESRKDDFWGAKVVDDGDTLVGMNVLGRLLMELREQVKQQGRDAALDIAPPDIPQFLLFGQAIEVAVGLPTPQAAEVQEQGSLFGADTAIAVEAVADPAPVVPAKTVNQAFRASGLPWVPHIPESWQVLRNGRLFGHRVETGFPDLPILEVSLRTGVRVRDMENLKRKQVMSQKEKYKRAAKGDIAYNMMRMWQGAVGPAPVDGLVSPAYVVVKPYDEANSSYYSYLFRTAAYMQEVNKFSRGIVADRNRLYWESFKQMPSLVPPRPEQDQIVAYLRAQDAHIARFIKAKRDLIRLLTEKKLRIIDHAVTRGLDAAVSLKPSGIEWLGEVPEHWEVALIKHVADVRFSGVDKHSHDLETPVRLCNYTDVYKNDRITDDMDLMRATATAAEIARLTLKAGDVILTKDSETPDDIGVPAWVPEDLPGVVCAYHLGLLRPVPDRVLGEFLFRAIGSARTAQQFHVLATGVTRFALGKHDVKNAVIALPPVEEQKTICRWITDECKPLDDAIARTEEEIKLIREYRDRQIADVVTGQVDVRGWQPGPDDVVDDAALAALGDENEDVTEEEDGDGED